MQRDRDFAAALRDFPWKLTFERMVIGYLARNPGDYAGAISVLPPNLQMMFVHAYQSYLFNLILSETDAPGHTAERARSSATWCCRRTRTGIPDHDKQVPVTKVNLDLVERQVRDRRAFVSGTLFGSESVIAEGEMGEIERAAIEQAKGCRPGTSWCRRSRTAPHRGSRRELVCEYRTSNWTSRRTSTRPPSSWARAATPRCSCGSS